MMTMELMKLLALMLIALLEMTETTNKEVGSEEYNKYSEEISDVNS